MQNKSVPAVVLLNLGSPASTSVADVRAYLKEFLNDPFVIDIAQPWRSLLVNGLILNTRPKKTAEAYEKIWTRNGSPLVNYTQALVEQVKEKWPAPVVMAMRYGQPNIRTALEKLHHQGVKDVIFLPLYPQYSYAATETSIVEFHKLQKKILPHARVTVIEDFFNDEGFISALVASMENTWKNARADLLLFSYHGIPERQIAKIKNPPPECCTPGCCDQWALAKNHQCYKAQCYETTRLVAKGLHLKPEQYQVSFQSRLGRTKWIEPYTDFVLKDLPAKGIKRLLVTSPSFTADCLETLEEIQIRYRDTFLQAGGEYFEYIPCVNSSPEFVDAVVGMLKKSSPASESSTHLNS